jgi:APA family basic amino acid/polyamine antiporter
VSDRVELARALGARDAALVTVGAVVGTGVFLTTGPIAAVLPHTGLILLVWLLGGLLSLAGALTYAELGAMFPRAGGQYHFLKEAWGELPAFLFGWASFLVIMSGGLAALAAGFGEYLGAFVPFFATGHVLLSLPLGPWTASLNGGQLAGVIAIIVLSLVNARGVVLGTSLQNVVTAAKIAAIAVLGVAGLVASSSVEPAPLAPLPSGGLLAPLGIAMIAVLWSFDGWYAATFLAGEMRDPERDLPRGLVIGSLIITTLYLLVNVGYVRGLPLPELAASSRVAEDAARALFGALGARLVSALILVSILGALAATVLYAPRIYLAMAEDGLFFRALARIHPRYQVPVTCIAAQCVWSVLLTLSGSFEQLYTYVVFAMFSFHVATGLAVFALRVRRPDRPRPFRVPGYPWVPALFVLTSLAFVINTLVERPTESGIGVVLVAAGVPAFLWWRRTPALEGVR